MGKNANFLHEILIGLRKYGLLILKIQNKMNENYLYYLLSRKREFSLHVNKIVKVLNLSILMPFGLNLHKYGINSSIHTYISY